MYLPESQEDWGVIVLREGVGMGNTQEQTGEYSCGLVQVAVFFHLYLLLNFWLEQLKIFTVFHDCCLGSLVKYHPNNCHNSSFESCFF